jgi:hypothetical protein
MKPGVTTIPFASISFFAQLRIDISDLDDVAVLDGHIGVKPGIAAAVDDLAVGNDDIIGRVGARTACGERDRREPGQRENRN